LRKGTFFLAEAISRAEQGRHPLKLSNGFCSASAVLQTKSSEERNAEFAAIGIPDFRAAGRHLYSLPYGRNTDRANFHLVLSEERGTCSTKHALLAELAREQQLPISLTLGIYAMHDRNTPGVGVILSCYNLPFIPEAHCYLTYEGERIDITRSGTEAAEPIDHFLYEETILPSQIGKYKVDLHKRFLRRWLAEDNTNRYSFEESWAIREECIASLTQ
jgi:hypothetical protein